MRVLFKNRFDALQVPGGDTVQMLNTKKALEKKGIIVDVCLDGKKDYRNYDIVHVFNLMRPFETTMAIWGAKKAKVPIVCSSIYWDFSEFNQVGRGSRIHSGLHKWLNEFQVEKIKEFIRGKRFSNNVEFCNYLLSDFKTTLLDVSLFLPNSVKEGELVKSCILKSAKYIPVYNAVDKDKFNVLSYGNVRKDAIIAARIDPRKNIRNLVSANLPINLDVYGGKTPLHNDYYESVRNNKKENVKLKALLKVNLYPIYIESTGYIYCLHGWKLQGYLS
ncbi:hypothetical protein ACFSJQ_13780 [Vibrio olivae]